MAQIVIENMADLLVIKAEIPSDDAEDDMSSEDREASSDTVFTSQLYLFEAIGCICSSSAVPPEKVVVFCETVMSPIFVDMEQNLPAARSGDQRALAQINHDILALGALARGLSDWTPGSANGGPPAEPVQEAFARASEATLMALDSLAQHFDIRTASRNAFSRLIGCIGARILPQLPRWIEGLMTQSSTRDEMALFMRSLDQVVFGFKTEVYNILDTLLTPFLERIFASLSSPSLGTDDEIQQNELKREYLNFIIVVLTNDLGSAIISSNNQAMFEIIISSIEQFTKDANDFPTARMAFVALSRMVIAWGGPDIVASTPQATNGTITPSPTLPGFDRFMIARFSPLCWALPAMPAFNPKDAQARIVLQEVATLQKNIYLKTGSEYLTYLKEQELRNMGMGDPMIDEFLGKLATLNLKDWRAYWIGVVTGAMASS